MLNLSPKIIQLSMDSLPKKSSSDFQSTSALRHYLFTTTLKVIDAINFSLDTIRKDNPYAEFIGHVDPKIFAKRLIENNLHSSDVTDFSKKLIHSPFFIQFWKKRCTPEALEKELFEFSIDQKCQTLEKVQLINLISNIAVVKNKYACNQTLYALVSRDFEIVRNYISDDESILPFSSGFHL